MAEGPILSFSHLTSDIEEMFPHCCGNGYFLMWGAHLESPISLDFLDKKESQPRLGRLKR